MLNLFHLTFLSIISSALLEYRFLQNFGEVFRDFSGNNNHGVNGDSSTSESSNVNPSDRGIFFQGSGSQVKLPQNDHSSSPLSFPSSFSIQAWTKVEDTKDGILFDRVKNPSSRLTISRKQQNEILELKYTKSFTFTISGQSKSFPSSFWVLVAVTKISDTFTLLKNLEQVGQSTFAFSESGDYSSCLGHVTEDTIKGFIALFSISESLNTPSYISMKVSSACLTLFDSCESSCFPAVVIGSAEGCISVENDPNKDSRSFDCPSGTACSAGIALKCMNCDSLSCLLNTPAGIISCFSDLGLGSTSSLVNSCVSTHRIVGSGCCYLECGSCVSSYSEKCSNCADLNAVVASIGCSCKNGYGGNHVLVAGSCVICQQECASCSNNSICLTCKATFAVPSTTTGCKCKDGYFGTPPLTTAAACKACNVECKTCGDASSCASCYSPKSYSSGGGCQCNYGYYGTYPKVQVTSCDSTSPLTCGPTCSSCNGPSCTSCISDNTIIFNNICICKPGFFSSLSLTTKSACQVCMSICQECENSTSCKVCKKQFSTFSSGVCKCGEGFYEIALSDKCLKCHNHCKTCSNSYSCNECKAENAEVNGFQGCKCKEKFFTLNPALDSSDACKACDSSCSQCTDASPCVSLCTKSNSILNSSGKCECLSGFYLKGSLTDEWSCEGCLDICSTCSDVATCDSCKDLNAVFDGKSCECKKGFYLSVESGTLRKCLNCQGFCDDCTSLNFCLSCLNKKLTADLKGVCSCESGFYLLNNDCFSCNSKCLRCSDPFSCDECKNNLIVTNDENFCKCPEGFFLSSFDECLSCDVTCLTCDEKRCLTCLAQDSLPNNHSSCECPAGSQLNNKKCICLEGFYSSYSETGLLECKICQDPCKTCKNLQFCISCINPLQIAEKETGGCYTPCRENQHKNENLCVCDQGFYAQPGGDDCLRCRNPCNTCRNETFCITCLNQEHYADQINGKCLKKCQKGTFFDSLLGNCQECPELCNDCKNFTTCTSCSENAELVEGLCECSRNSTKSKKTCIIRYFDFSISKDSTRIFITFTENLENSLKRSEFKIKIGKNLKFSYTFTNITRKKYIISLNPRESFSNNTLFSLKILKNPIKSDSGSILLNYEKSLLLESFHLNKTNEVLNQIIQSSRSLSQVSVSSAVGVSIISNPASAWILVNTLQLVMYLPLSENNLTFLIRDFCTALTGFNLLPNPMLFIFSQSTSGSPSRSQREAGIDSSVFWINGGQNLGFLVFLIALYPFIRCLSKVTYGKIALTLFKVLKNYKYGLFLRFWIQTYLDLSIFSLIQMRSEIIKPEAGYFNLASATVCMLMVTLTSPFLFISSYVSMSRLQDAEDSEFESMYGSLFYEFKNDKGFLSSQYYTIFFIRRLSYVLAHFYLEPWPVFKSGVHIGFTVLIMIFLIAFRPYKENSILLSSFFGEIGCLVAFVVDLMLALGGKNRSEILEMVFIFTVVFVMVFQTAVGFYQFCKGVARVYRKLEKIRALQFVKSVQTSKVDIIQA